MLALRINLINVNFCGFLWIMNLVFSFVMDVFIHLMYVWL